MVGETRAAESIAGLLCTPLWRERESTRECWLVHEVAR